MKILTPRQHGVIDYAVVVLFLAAPSLFGFTGVAATLSYALAAVHLLLTLFTAFPLGLVKVVPFGVHGTLELVISVALVAVPWVLGFAEQTRARNFYVGTGLAVFVVYLITDYKAADARPQPS